MGYPTPIEWIFMGRRNPVLPAQLRHHVPRLLSCIPRYTNHIFGAGPRLYVSPCLVLGSFQSLP